MLNLEILLPVFVTLWAVSAFVFVIHLNYFKAIRSLLIPVFVLTAFIPFLDTYLPDVYVFVLSMLSILAALFFLVAFVPKAMFKALKNGQGVVNIQKERFKAISEHGADMSLIYHKDGHITHANDALKQWTGFTIADVKKGGFSVFCDSTQLTTLNEYIELSKNNPEHSYVLPELLVKTRLNQELYFEVKATYLPKTPGVEGWVLNFRNIQRRKEVQKNLDQHKAINDLLLQSSQRFLTATKENINTRIESVLKLLIEEVGLKGCILWQDMDDQINARFVCPKDAPLPKGWKSFSGLKKQSWLYKKLENFEDIYIADIDDLPLDAESEKKALVAAGAESALFLPLKNSVSRLDEDEDVSLGGVLALALPKNTINAESFVSQLSLFAKMVAVAIHRHFSEDQLRILSQAVEQSPVSVVIVNPEGKVEFVNKRFEENTGYKAQEVLGKDSSMFNTDKPNSDVMKNLWATIIGGNPWAGELLNRKKNGAMFWEHVRITPIRSSTGAIKHFLSVREDISLRKEYEEALAVKSHYDMLTKLPNRSLVMDRLEEAVNRREGDEMVAAIVVGLDMFKGVNDAYGHQSGDILLIDAAERINQAVDKLEHTVGRLAGDEFMVVLSECTKEQVELAAGHINEAFKSSFDLDGQDVTVTATLGVALSPTDGDNAKTLLQNAEVAMHRAKERGRDTFNFYTEEIHKDAMRRVKMENLLRNAIDANELVLNYQPIIDTENDTVTGAEALIRWQNDTLGFVSPMDFIPLAEDIGLIIPIGEWVLETACAQLKSWEQIEGAPKYITVNVSARQFEGGDFYAVVEKVIEKYKVNPKSLHLEVTESLLIDEDMRVEEDLSKLSNIGVRISLDDFGTGYSSLSYLKKYHFDTLKIDRSFVRDVPEDQDDKALIEAIMLMAHSLKMDVVAEGVETQEQKEYLKTLKCDRLQGYFFSKPLPSEEFNDFVSNWSKNTAKH